MSRTLPSPSITAMYVVKEFQDDAAALALEEKKILKYEFRR